MIEVRTVVLGGRRLFLRRGGSVYPWNFVQTVVWSAIRYFLLSLHLLTILAAVCPRMRKYQKEVWIEVAQVVETELQDPCLRQASPSSPTKPILPFYTSRKLQSQSNVESCENYAGGYVDRSHWDCCVCSLPAKFRESCAPPSPNWPQ